MNFKFYDSVNNLKDFVIDKKKKFILGSALLLSGVLAVNGISSSIKNNNNTIIENEIGHEDINLTFNGVKNVFGKGVKDNEFVVLNIGDSKKQGVGNQDKKIKYCNEKDIALGIIVTPTSILTNDIYDNVELVRGIINEYEINFPVYLNIDSIIENNDIDNDMKIKIIKTFLDKCTANGIYVGVYGTDTNLVYLHKYCEIKEFDAYVVMDKSSIEYPGSYNVYKNLDGKIISKLDLENVINNNNLNTSERLKNDGVYTIQDGDILLEIAMKYNMSVNALLKYNGIKEEDFVSGRIIKIPSVIDNVIPTNNENVSYELLDKPIRGADFSHYQDNNKMDWNFIKENYEFVILKCSEGTTVIDDDFEDFSKKCSNYNIPYGVYCLNAYKGINFKNDEDFMTAQNSQIDTCLKMIANKNIDYPVYFDIEGGSDIVSKEFTKDQIIEMLDNWYEKIKNTGYIPGLYCSESTYNYISDFYDTSKFEVWTARYKYESAITLDETPVPEYRNGVNMYQTSKTTTDAGAPVEATGYTDINYSFIDYSKSIINDDIEYNKDLVIKDFDRNNHLNLIVTGTSIALGAGCIITGGYIIKRKRNKVKSRYLY